MLRYLEMIPGKVQLPKKQFVVQCNFVRPKRAGLWIPAKTVGDRVKKGELIGTYIDIYTGDEVEREESEFDGMLVQYAGNGIFSPAVEGAYAGGPIVEEIENP
jgi:predicted deacylase